MPTGKHLRNCYPRRGNNMADKDPAVVITKRLLEDRALLPFRATTTAGPRPLCAQAAQEAGPAAPER
jgi:hypothetical protein